MSGPLVLVVPGELGTLSGGYGYDRRMMRELVEAGWNVTSVALDPTFPYPTRAALEHARATLAEIPSGTPALIDGLALGAMPEVLEREQRRLRLIALIHHPLSLESGLPARVAAALERSERRALDFVCGIVATSHATVEALGSLGIDPARCAVAEPGTDRAPLASASRARAGRQAARPLELLCVATLIPRKGHRVLIEALQPLATLDWRLTCVGGALGNPSAAEQLRESIAAIGLADRVELVGEMSGAQLEAQYAGADLFVLPTLYEGYGMVVGEALARGLPVIATRTGAIPKLVEAHGAGIVVPPNDVEALRAALERALTDAGTRERMTLGARRARDELPTWQQAGARLSQVLEDLLEIAHAATRPG